MNQNSHWTNSRGGTPILVTGTYPPPSIRPPPPPQTTKLQPGKNFQQSLSTSIKWKDS